MVLDKDAQDHRSLLFDKLSRIFDRHAQKEGEQALIHERMPWGP